MVTCLLPREELHRILRHDGVIWEHPLIADEAPLLLALECYRQNAEETARFWCRIHAAELP